MLNRMLPPSPTEVGPKDSVPIYLLPCMDLPNLTYPPDDLPDDPPNPHDPPILLVMIMVIVVI